MRSGRLGVAGSFGIGHASTCAACAPGTGTPGHAAAIAAASKRRRLIRGPG